MPIHAGTLYLFYYELIQMMSCNLAINAAIVISYNYIQATKQTDMTCWVI